MIYTQHQLQRTLCLRLAPVSHTVGWQDFNYGIRDTKIILWMLSNKSMLNPNQKFHYKYRLIHFVIGSIATILVIGLAINRFYPIADKAPLNRTIDPLLILSFTALQACEFFYFAIGTYIQVTPHDIRIKVPFIRINSSWQNIEGFDAIVMPKSVYTEPGFIFREPPFQKTTFIKRLFLPELINNKALPVSPYLRDKEIKELELLVKWQLKQTSL